jgi:hypothetical protein
MSPPVYDPYDDERKITNENNYKYNDQENWVEDELSSSVSSIGPH